MVPMPGVTSEEDHLVAFHSQTSSHDRLISDTSASDHINIIPLFTKVLWTLIRRTTCLRIRYFKTLEDYSDSKLEDYRGRNEQIKT